MSANDPDRDAVQADPPTVRRLLLRSPSLWICLFLAAGLATYGFLESEKIRSTYYLYTLPSRDREELEAALRQHLSECEWVRFDLRYLLDAPIDSMTITDRTTLDQIARVVTVDNIEKGGAIKDEQPILIETSKGLLIYFSQQTDTMIIYERSVFGDIAWHSDIVFDTSPELRVTIASAITRAADAIDKYWELD